MRARLALVLVPLLRVELWLEHRLVHRKDAQAATANEAEDQPEEGVEVVLEEAADEAAVAAGWRQGRPQGRHGGRGIHVCQARCAESRLFTLVAIVLLCVHETA